MPTHAQLREQLEKHLAASRAIVDKTEGENRDFTAAEMVIVQQHVDAAKELMPQVRVAKADERVRRQLSALGPDREGYQPSGGSYGGFASSSGYKATSSVWAERVANQLTKAATVHGVKDLAAGSLDVPNVVEVAVQIPARPNRLLDLIPTKDMPGNAFAYARQVARTNNSATVADHALKPTSHYTFTEVEDRARVFAHLSEPIALRYFEDFTELMTIVDIQMYEGLREEIEDNCAAGDGTGENFVGILNTSGVYAQPYATSLPATLRAARTTLEVANETPTAWVLNPADMATLDLLTDSQNRFYGVEIDKLMGGLAKVSSTAIPAGHAILGDWSQSRLYVRQNAGLAIDRSGPLFTHNECQMRVESRLGFAVLRPAAFSIVDLTP